MQVEPIIKARFNKFRDSLELNNIADGLAFERFVNYSILSVHQPDAFNADSELLECVCVGGESDMGIDGIAIKLNGIIVRSKTDIDDILKRYKRAVVEFIFIQSKFKAHFNKGELNNFVDGVRDFLSDTHHFPMNEKVKFFVELKEYLLSDNIVIMWEKNPLVRCYYVAMGRWRNAPDLVGVYEHFKNDISSLNAFDETETHFVDSESLKSICDSIESTFQETINTRHVMPLTEVNGVSNSCIALCYADEYLKLLKTDEDIIRKSLFDDNVRDYQGENIVNSEIEDTIQDQPAKFILLNNGITVVCDEFIQNNTKLTIKNPQVVNGCQTSHVIFYANEKGLDVSKVPLTVKFISTDNIDISNEIVRGTNRQNIVLDEAFEATKKFHKDLEQFFNAISPDYEKIYYERRSKQYNHNPTVKQTQKINLRVLTQYFIGMFLDLPHVSHRHESILLRDYQNKIYQEQQSFLPYFTVALSFYYLEKFFREESLTRNIASFKAHLLMMFRESISGFRPKLNSEKSTDEHSQRILDFTKDKENLLKRFSDLVDIFNSCRNIWVNELHRGIDGMKDVPSFTDLLLKETRKAFPVNSPKVVLETHKPRHTGKVVKASIDRNGQRYGFIFRKPENIFFHSSQNKQLNFIDLTGRLVSYKITEDSKTGKSTAIDIEIED